MAMTTAELAAECRRMCIAMPVDVRAQLEEYRRRQARIPSTSAVILAMVRDGLAQSARQRHPTGGSNE